MASGQSLPNPAGCLGFPPASPNEAPGRWASLAGRVVIPRTLAVLNQMAETVASNAPARQVAGGDAVLVGEAVEAAAVERSGLFLGGWRPSSLDRTRCQPSASGTVALLCGPRRWCAGARAAARGPSRWSTGTLVAAGPAPAARLAAAMALRRRRRFVLLLPGCAPWGGDAPEACPASSTTLGGGGGEAVGAGDPMPRWAASRYDADEAVGDSSS